MVAPMAIKKGMKQEKEEVAEDRGGNRREEGRGGEGGGEGGEGKKRGRGGAICYLPLDYPAS